MKKWASRLMKISFVLFALLAIFLVIMVNMGGSSDTLKGALEDYLMQASGMPAEIETLNKMTFYPYISVDIEDISITPAEADAAAITVEKAKIAISFWDMILSRQAFKDLQIENAVFAADTLSENEVILKELAIDEDPNGRSFLDVNGTLGAHAFEVELDVARDGKKYKLGEESPFSASLGDVSTKGTLRPRTLGGFHIRDFVIDHKEQEIINGTLSFVRKGPQVLDLEGSVLIPEHGTKTALDVNVLFQETTEITGNLKAEFLAAADFSNSTRLANALKDWQTMIKLKGETHIDLAIEAELFARDGTQVEDYQGRLKHTEDGVAFKP